MLAGAANRDYFNIISGSIHVDDLKDNNAVLLYKAVLGCEEAGEESIESLLTRIEKGILKTLVIETLSSSQFLINPEDVIRSSVKTIILRNMVEYRTEIEYKIKNFNSIEFPSDDELGRLISEKLLVDKKIEDFKGDSR